MTSTEFYLAPFPLGGQQATIVRWLRQPGTLVAAGDPLLVAVNDRVEVALPALASGLLTEILAPEGAAIAVGALLATIAAGAADAPRQPETRLGLQIARESQLAAAMAAPRRLSPAARRVADITGVDIAHLRGSGVGGRIVKADVLAAHLAQAGAPENQALSARQPVPAHPLPAGWLADHTFSETYTLSVIEVDLDPVAAVLAGQRASFERRGLSLAYLTCIALAVVESLLHHPLLNSMWDTERILVRRRVQLAIAARARPATVICDAQDLNLRGLARALASAQVAGVPVAASTFTIVDLSDPVWGDPSGLARRQSALLGVGAIRRRPLVVADRGIDRIVVHPAALLTLAYDVRVLGQCHADAFLRDVRRRLEHFCI